MSNPFDGVPKIVSESDAELLRNVRDRYVTCKRRPKEPDALKVYFQAFLSQLADRLEEEAARNQRLCEGLKDIAHRAKIGELDTMSTVIAEVKAALKTDALSEREAIVLRSRLIEGRTLQEVASMLNVTRERIRQIEAKAIRRIREATGK